MSGIAIRSKEGAQRCVFCFDDFASEATEAQAIACPACGTAAHQDCWEELNACPTPGCGHRPQRLGPPRAQVARGGIPPTAPHTFRLRAGPRPSPLARASLYRGLLLSVALHLVASLITLTAAGLAVWLLEDVTILLIAWLLPAFFLNRTVQWLPHARRALLGIEPLLDSSEPRAGTAWVLPREVDKRKRLVLQIDGQRMQVHHVHLGTLLRPLWLRLLRGRRRVWVYGHEGERPWVIEFPSGQLVLCTAYDPDA